MHSALERNSINYVQEVILLGATELARRTGMDASSCRALINLISPSILPAPLVPRQDESLKTGLQGLDDLGGIPVGHLFEVYGEAGVGKSQFALSCALNVALPREHGGNDGFVVYISTDHAFPINRLMTLLECFQETNPSFDPSIVLERILVQELSVRDLDDFERIVIHGIPALLEVAGNIKLIIIDSIAYNFRSDTTNSFMDRASKLAEIGLVLKKYAAQYNAGVLLTNQVTDSFNQPVFCTTSVNHGQSHWIKISVDDLDFSKKPALGLAWTNCLNTRCNSSFEIIHQGLLMKHSESRKLVVSFSSFLPQMTIPFSITRQGLIQT